MERIKGREYWGVSEGNVVRHEKAEAARRIRAVLDKLNNEVKQAEALGLRITLTRERETGYAAEVVELVRF